jgi:hypothetical protein
MNRSTCTSELSIENIFSEKIHIHVSLGSIVNTAALRFIATVTLETNKSIYV